MAVEGGAGESGFAAGCDAGARFEATLPCFDDAETIAVEGFGA